MTDRDTSDPASQDYLDVAKKTEQANIADESASYVEAIERSSDGAKIADAENADSDD